MDWSMCCIEMTLPHGLKLTDNGEKVLTDYQLGNITVRAKVGHTGMLKIREKRLEY